MAAQGYFDVYGDSAATYLGAMELEDALLAADDAAVSRAAFAAANAWIGIGFERYVLYPIIQLARHSKIDLAFAVWDKLRQSGATNSLAYDALMLNPTLQGLRSDPRFEEYVADSRVGFEEYVEALRDLHRRGQFPAYLEASLNELLPKLDKRQLERARN